MTVAALVLGAGSGRRLRETLGEGVSESQWGGDAPGALPKAFVPLAGRCLLLRSLEALAASAEVDLVVPVVAQEAMPRLAALESELRKVPKLRPAVAGGAERQDSVRCGLEALPPEVTHVAVHDAARPLVRPEDVSRVVRAARSRGAALLAVPVTDTIKRVEAGAVVATPPRSECYAAQTPQVFRIDWLRDALAKAEADGVQGTDDAALVERLGVTVEVVEGDPANLKITSAEDLVLAEAWLRRRGEALP
jgi:2-C-methyl-D-erythritol 4-phosphate cytidylyltransferase